MMRSSFSFLGLVKLTRMDSSKGWTYMRAYAIPFKLAIKNNGVVTRNSGGKMKVNISCIFCKGNMWLFNMTLICCSFQVWDILTPSLAFLGLGDPFCLSYDYIALSSWPLIPCWVKWCQTSDSCRWYVQEKSWFQFLPLIHYLTFLPQSWIKLAYSTISFVFCRWYGIHYRPPSTDHFLSTSTHYLGRWSRNSLLVPYSLHVSMTSSLHSTIGLHHWPSIEWFFRCLNSASLFTLVDCADCTLWAIVITSGFSHAC